MGTTNVLSSYLMTVDKHRFALMWLVCSRNKIFRVGPNISEEFVPGGTNFRGVQIKRDMPISPHTMNAYPAMHVQWADTISPSSFTATHAVFPLAGAFWLGLTNAFNTLHELLFLRSHTITVLTYPFVK